MLADLHQLRRMVQVYDKDLPADLGDMVSRRAGPARLLYELHPSCLFIIAMMKLKPVRDILEEALLEVILPLTVEDLYNVLAATILAINKQKFPLWVASVDGQSYAVGHLVWLKKVGMLTTKQSKGVNIKAVLLGERRTKHFLQTLTESLFQRLSRVLAIDAVARCCQLRVCATQSVRMGCLERSTNKRNACPCASSS